MQGIPAALNAQRHLGLLISNTHYSNVTGGVAMASRVDVRLSITPSCPAISAVALAMTFGGGGDGESRNAGRKEGGQLGREKGLFNYT